MMEIFLDKVAELLYKWNHEGENDSVTMEECKEHAYELLGHRLIQGDGYQLAKYLDDRLGYHDADTSLVEYMDTVPSLREAAHRRVVAAWVERENIVIPEAYKNKTVTFERGGGESLQGEVVEIYPKEARVLICCASEGHVKEGMGTHGMIIDWEKVEEIPGLPKWPNELLLAGES